MNQKICGYYLDKQQQEIVLDNSKHLLVIAGAGSGKTLTILGKIYYLINVKKINPTEIICISFTKASSNSLKEKIYNEFNLSVPVYTFHKLALNILENKYQIADPSTLNYIIDEFLTIDIFNNIDLILKYFKIKNEEEYKKILNSKEIIQLKTLLVTFIHLFKCNNYKLEDYPNILKKIRKIFNFNYKTEKAFLIISLNVYLKYQKYLQNNNEIDFDDMLVLATDKVNKKFNKKIKYIIIDEYQDTSFVRFNLVKAILEKTGARLMVVGDDFQSIYRFTGCDINLFINFKTFFKDASVMKIENTYRNSNELINIAGSFVMKNPKQIRKNLKSNKHLNYPLVIIYYYNIKSTFKKLIEKIYDNTKKSILILGRNNNDINVLLDNDLKIINNKLTYIKNKNIKLNYMTIHKSKGLEDENVIIINMIDDMLGFPTKIKDDKILRVVTSSNEKYIYSEERRLFYVALTRTKNKVYLLVPLKKQSQFITEIINDYKNLILLNKDV